MAQVFVDENVLASVRGRVVVIVGGANGIGAATVTRLFQAGAHVFNGDLESEAGTDLTNHLRSSSQDSAGSVTFAQVDVTDYGALLALFDAAYQKHGRVDMAIFCAGITETPGWITSDSVTLVTVREPPKPIVKIIDINLNGCIYFTRIALAYLKQEDPDTNGTSNEMRTFSKSLTLVSSGAGFRETPGVCGYSASKHGIIGLMRALRAICPVRVNTICPWATETRMIAAQVSLFKDNGLPLQTPADVAEMIHQVAADPKLHGASVFVGGGQGIDIETGLAQTEPLWMGQHLHDLQIQQEEVFGSKAKDWLNTGES